ncbi:MAG: cytochrome P450 [Myxococcota bacterium]
MIPTLSGTPLLGNLLEMRQDWLALLRRIPEECGDIGRIRLGPRSGVVFNTPTAAQTIFIEEHDAFEKGPTLRRLVRVFLGDGLLTCTQAHHLRLRRLLGPTFSPQRMQGYAAMMAAAARDARAALVPGVVDIHALLMSIAVRVAGRALFSAEMAERAPTLEKAVSDALDYVAYGVAHPIRPPLWAPTAINRRARAARATFDAIFSEMIDARRAAPDDRGDVLSSLLAARDVDDAPLSDAEIRDQLATLMLTGFETAAAAMAWILALLAERPDVEQRLLAEVDALPADPCAEHIESLSYCKQILNEALRLCPPAHTLGRRALRPVTVDGHTIATGEVVVVSPWLLHRRPDHFPDPERFEPERFAPERIGALPRCAYIPFGAGPRACIGQRFSTVEVQIVLATLLRRFRFRPLCPTRPRASLSMTMRPDNLKVEVAERWR